MYAVPKEMRLPTGASSSVKTTRPTQEAFDEAFASVTDKDLRIDAPATKPAGETGLAEGLRDQLTALQQQQRELSRLLNGLK